MKRRLKIFGKTLLIFYLLVIHLFAAIFIYQTYLRGYLSAEIVDVENVQVPIKEAKVPTPLPIPSIAEKTPDQIVSNEINRAQNGAPFSELKLMIPVAGVKREQLLDTFTDARAENRVHDAIDIPAPNGTPVLAASDGAIAKFFDSDRGGITIYQISSDKKFVFYYAHLQKRAENIQENQFIKQGTIIGYVGDTGNAGEGNYHLHFSVAVLGDPDRYSEGININPYPLLMNGVELSQKF